MAPPPESPRQERQQLVVGLGAGAAGFTDAHAGLAGHERGGGQGPGDLATQDMVLNIGPQHPATHGVLRLRLTLDGERVVHCEPIIGYMHRGVEKLFEVRDYRQIIMLANRHDWLSAFSNELGVVLGVEAAIPLAVITFFAAFLPIIGATLAGALAAAVALATQGPETALIVVLVVLVVQQVEGDILLPVIMYRQVALHPVVVLLALAVGAAIGGVLGAVVAVPLTAAAAAAIAAAKKTPEIDPDLPSDEPDAGTEAKLATAD